MPSLLLVPAIRPVPRVVDYSLPKQVKRKRWPNLLKAVRILGRKKPRHKPTPAQDESKELPTQVTPGASSIPWEILSEILLLTCSQAEFVRWGGPHDPKRFGAVSRAWRIAVIATPALWSSLSLHIHPPCISGQQQILSTWMSRSKSTPLKLELLWYPERVEGAYTVESWFSDHIYNFIIVSMNRWERLVLSLPQICVMKMLSRPLPSLTSLSFATTPLMATPMILSPSHVPQLRDLSILGVSHNPAYARMPWTQLTTFKSIHCISLPEAQKLLRHCVALEHCSMRIRHAEDDTPFRSSAPLIIPPNQRLARLTMAKLRSFWLYLGVHDKVNPILEGFTMPALTDLRIYNKAATPATVSDLILKKFLDRSCCQLETLRLDNLSSRVGDGATYLQWIPTLVNLQIIFNYCDIVTPYEQYLLASRT